MEADMGVPLDKSGAACEPDKGTGATTGDVAGDKCCKALFSNSVSDCQAGIEEAAEAIEDDDGPGDVAVFDDLDEALGILSDIAAQIDDVAAHVFAVVAALFRGDLGVICFEFVADGMRSRCVKHRERDASGNECGFHRGSSFCFLQYLMHPL